MRTVRRSEGALLALSILGAAALAAGVGRDEGARAAVGAIAAPGSSPVVNGDFEAGDLSGWTLFSTENGTVWSAVVPFDTDGDGAATGSAAFTVGQATFEGFDVQRGGGVYQEVVVGEGELSLSADVASEHPYPFCNFDGGTVALLLDGSVQDSRTFGEVCGPVVRSGQLSASVVISAPGRHELRFLFTRAAMPSGVADYLDDVEIEGPAVAPAARLTGLIAVVEEYQLAQFGSSLVDKLRTARRLLDARKLGQASDVLDSFVNQVRAQEGKGITEAQATELTQVVAQITAAIATG